MAYEKEIEYEELRQLELMKSRKTAWIIATVAIGLAILSTVTIFLLMPLKTVVPYVIKENVITGETRIATMLNEKTLTTDEVTDKFFASDYVMKREQYYYEMLAKDYYHVLLFSNEIVQSGYKKIYNGEKSRDKLLKDKFKVEVKILGVVLSESSGTQIATVRTKMTTKDLKGTTKGLTSYNTLTLAYEYQPRKQMSEGDRLLNPLGFTVLSYRKDREVSE